MEKAREKLKAAEDQGSEHVDALRMGLEKMEVKLSDAQKQLSNIN